MSLSITCTVGITKIYKNMPIRCVDGAGCWRNYMRVYAICCAVLYTIGTLALAFYQRPRALNREESVTRKDGMHASLLTDVAAGSNDVEALVDKEFGGVPVFGGPAASSQNTRSYSTGATRTSSTNSANGQGTYREFECIEVEVLWPVFLPTGLLLQARSGPHPPEHMPLAIHPTC
jgi:hypothetical protein